MRIPRLWLTIGGGLAAVLAAVALGFVILRHERAPTTPPPASTGGLVVQMGRPDDAKPDPTTPLRCFVNGQFVGMETLADCARKNGVATQALDVGVDSSGGLAAAGQAGSAITPLPPTAAEAAAPDQAGADASIGASRTAQGDCLRYGAGAWRKVGDGLTLSACVSLLYDGRCVKTGEASYGRWMGQTVRLVPHRVEISPDNHSFRPLAEQSDDTCAIADF